MAAVLRRRHHRSRALRRRRTFSSLGGVVTASCTGSTAALVSASPQPGYHVEVEDNGPEPGAGAVRERRPHVRRAGHVPGGPAGARRQRAGRLTAAPSRNDTRVPSPGADSRCSEPPDASATWRGDVEPQTRRAPPAAAALGRSVVGEPRALVGDEDGDAAGVADDAHAQGGAGGRVGEDVADERVDRGGQVVA